MIISKDLFIFGEHIFATIIPEVGPTTTTTTSQLQDQQDQQITVATTATTNSVVIGEKSTIEKVIKGGEEHTTATPTTPSSAKSLSQEETVAVVIVAAAAAAAAAATVAATTAKEVEVEEHTRNLEIRETKKQQQKQKQLKEYHQNQQHNIATSNGSIKAIKTTTTTTINREETYNDDEGKKLTFQQIAQKKAKETEVHNSLRRPKKKLLVVGAETTEDVVPVTEDGEELVLVVRAATTIEDNGQLLLEEKKIAAEEEDEDEEVSEIHKVEQRPLVQRNFSKLKIISLQQPEQQRDCHLQLEVNCIDNTETAATITKIVPNNLKSEDLSLNMGKVILANSTRNDHTMVTTPFITKNQELQSQQHRFIQLTFQNINFSHGDRKILSNVSGLVSPGEVLAVMGPSGSGKTTLLDCLSGQRRAENGQIFLNREQLSKKWRRKICYVLQEEIFFSGLTLRETVMYTAMLRLPDKMLKRDKIQLVDRILQELELKSCEQTKFGDYMSRGLSGGEKKRANIACELLTNPLLMLLDEPTSGLDSHAAISLMRVLKRYARQERKTVVISVHQPSSQMFHMFDKLLLLYNGQTAYFGEVKNIYRYFEDIGVAIKAHYNPADFLLEQLKSHPETREKLFAAAKESHCNFFNSNCITTEIENNTNQFKNGNNLKERRNGIIDRVTNTNEKNTHKHDALINNIINTYYKDHHHINHDTVLIMEANHDQKDNCTEEETAAQQLWCGSESNFSSSSGDSAWLDDENSDEDWLDYPTHFSTQLSVLLSRSFKEAKPRMLSKLNWFQTIGLGLMAGAIWFQIPRTEEYLHDLQGWMFFSQTYWMLFALFGALNSFPSEREVISKERRSGAYKLSAYYLAKMFAELPLVVTLPTVYLIISYPMLGCSSLKLFVLMLVFLLLNTIVAQSVGFFIGAYCMDMNVSITLSALYTLATQLFGGYLSSRIPEGLSWIRYTSMIHYAYQNMQILEFREGPKISCGSTTSYEICKSNITNFIPYEEILKAQNSTSPLWLNTMILMMFFLVFRCLGYAVLRYIRCPNAS